MTEAKDTVTSPEKYPWNYEGKSQKDLLEMQAEKSFKAGMQEVVNAATKRMILRDHMQGCYGMVEPNPNQCNACWWQNFLKEKGLK